MPALRMSNLRGAKNSPFALVSSFRARRGHRPIWHGRLRNRQTGNVVDAISQCAGPFMGRVMPDKISATSRDGLPLVARGILEAGLLSWIDLVANYTGQHTAVRF